MSRLSLYISDIIPCQQSLSNRECWQGGVVYMMADIINMMHKIYYYN